MRPWLPGGSCMLLPRLREEEEEEGEEGQEPRAYRPSAEATEPVRHFLPRRVTQCRAFLASLCGPRLGKSERWIWAVEATPGPPPPRADRLTSLGTRRARPELLQAPPRPGPGGLEMGFVHSLLWREGQGKRQGGAELDPSQSRWVLSVCVCTRVCAVCERAGGPFRFDAPNASASFLCQMFALVFADLLPRHGWRGRPSAEPPQALVPSQPRPTFPFCPLQASSQGEPRPGQPPVPRLSWSVPTFVAEAAGQAPSACRERRGQVPDPSRTGVVRSPRASLLVAPPPRPWERRLLR